MTDIVRYVLNVHFARKGAVITFWLSEGIEPAI